MAVSDKDIFRYTTKKIEQLNRGSDTGAGKARFAEIRRGVGKIPGEMPTIWGILFEDMPEAMYSVSGQPTRSEWAVYMALTLYALHQQGNDPVKTPMNQQGERLGLAVSRLCHDADGKYSREDRERIERRFAPLATSDSMPELSHHLRAIVQLLKAEGIPLDYPALAVDIYRYQFDDKTNDVRLTWGQDFYRYNKESEDTTNEE